MTAKKRLFRVMFINQGKVYELYARRVGQGNLYGFVDVEELVFGEKSSLVVDPAEERLKTEFAGVSVIHVPLHSVIRIDQVDAARQGPAKIVALEGRGDTVVAYPGPLLPPGSAPTGRAR